MNDKQLYAQILGIVSPWKVTDVALRLEQGEVEVRVSGSDIALQCPQCGKDCPGYDSRERRWRHLDTCQYRTVLVADVPRVKCAEHGVHQIEVPWAAPGSRFTMLFEGLVILWLKEASLVAVGRRMDLTWDLVDGILARAVKRGLCRREQVLPERISVDEKSFKKRHDYVTVVTDLDRSKVLHVADGRKKETLAGFYDSLGEAGRRKIKVVTMDMWPAYISATREALEDADQKIAFDRFHVVRHLANGVDMVRRQENRALRKEGDDTLAGTRWLWIQSPLTMSDASWDRLQELKDRSLRTARAWAIQDSAAGLWDHGPREDVEAFWKQWLQWPLRSRLKPMVRVARMIRAHLYGIVNAVVHRATNATAEGINSVIQKLKGRAHGYRNRERFRNAIYFHLGGLDMMPRPGES